MNSERKTNTDTATRIRSEFIWISNNVKVLWYCTKHLTYIKMCSEVKDWSATDFNETRHLNDDSVQQRESAADILIILKE